MAEPGVDLVQLWTTARFALGGFFCLAGALLCVIGSIGVLRFPDFYTRLHAASVTDTGGVLFLIAGMALMAPGPLVFFKLVAILLFLLLTGPAASHAIAHAAHVSKLQPLIGDMASGRKSAADTMEGG
jgi:multicomponent Na+:H+ antiporter subunit G